MSEKLRAKGEPTKAEEFGAEAFPGVEEIAKEGEFDETTADALRPIEVWYWFFSP